VVNGVGAAGVAITRILLGYGFRHIILCDSKGAIYEGRNDLGGEKDELSELTNSDKRTGDLASVISGADVFIGVSKPGVLTENMVRAMNEKPIIFAMANPTPEIMPDVAYRGGAAIVGTGRSDFPNQINNALAFPGLFRGLLDKRIVKVTCEMKLKAAEALASLVVPKKDSILPLITDKRVPGRIAKALIVR
jgi:malate dehydrogenase (oxaloacetate-decarboxylating)